MLSYLQTYEPHELKRSGPNEYCTRTHDSLKISNGKWCWNSRGFGGRTALDYLIKVRGMDFVGGGRSPVRLPCPAAPGTAQAEAPEAFCASRSKPVCHSDGILSSRQRHRPGHNGRVFQSRYAL